MKFCEENLNLYTPTPFYEEYSMSGVYEEDVMEERDISYFKSLYPQYAAQVMEHIEEECDKMEYEGSRMFDEHPDRWMVRELVEKIYVKVQHLEPLPISEEVQAVSVDEAGLEAAGGPGFGPGYGPGFGPGYGPGFGPGYGPGFGPGEGVLGNIIPVLLYDEMYRRRCRYRRCRSRFY